MMNKFKLWLARKLFKGDIYIGEGAVISFRGDLKVNCKQFHVDGYIDGLIDSTSSYSKQFGVR